MKTSDDESYSKFRSKYSYAYKFIQDIMPFLSVNMIISVVSSCFNIPTKFILISCEYINTHISNSVKL